MLDSSAIDGTPVVVIRLDGGVTEAEEAAAVGRIRAAIAEHGRADLLVDYEDLDLTRVEPKAVWNDLRSLGLATGIERVAVVADSGILTAAWKTAGVVAPITVRSFPGRADALAWLREPGSAGAPSRGVAVVTGGSAGLGRAIVRELAGRGFDVAVLARGEDGVAGAVADVERAGRRGLGIPTDVADHGAVDAAADRVERELGPIEVWVNDAMVSVFAQFWEIEPADFERALSVDFLGYVNGTRAALRHMRPRDRGAIVQVGSALAHRGIPLQSAYCSSKGAITRFNESLVAELLHDRSAVTVSQVDMPAMNTMQFEWVKSNLPKHAQPVPPIYQPEICAAAVADVAIRPRRRSWVGESTVFTIVGNRLATRVADWQLARTGYSGQQASEPDLPVLPANLHEPVAGDHGAHGPFDHRSWRVTPQTWAVTHRPATVAIGSAALLSLAAALPTIVRRGVRAAAPPVAKQVARTAGRRALRRLDPAR